jgi:hypothetical protein
VTYDLWSEMFQTDNTNVTDYDDSGETFGMTDTPTYTENVIKGGNIFNNWHIF